MNEIQVQVKDSEQGLQHCDMHSDIVQQGIKR